MRKAVVPPLPEHFLRKEIRDYLRACEYLIAAAQTNHDPQFSMKERQIMEFYVKEVSKILDLIPHVKQ
jgi:hypothetical protein